MNFSSFFLFWRGGGGGIAKSAVSRLVNWCIWKLDRLTRQSKRLIEETFENIRLCKNLMEKKCTNPAN